VSEPERSGPSVGSGLKGERKKPNVRTGVHKWETAGKNEVQGGTAGRQGSYERGRLAVGGAAQLRKEHEGWSPKWGERRDASYQGRGIKGDRGDWGGGNWGNHIKKVKESRAREKKRRGGLQIIERYTERPGGVDRGQEKKQQEKRQGSKGGGGSFSLSQIIMGGLKKSTRCQRVSVKGAASLWQGMGEIMAPLIGGASKQGRMPVPSGSQSDEDQACL